MSLLAKPSLRPKSARLRKAFVNMTRAIWEALALRQKEQLILPLSCTFPAVRMQDAAVFVAIVSSSWLPPAAAALRLMLLLPMVAAVVVLAVVAKVLVVTVSVLALVLLLLLLLLPVVVVMAAAAVVVVAGVVGRRRQRRRRWWRCCCCLWLWRQRWRRWWHCCWWPCLFFVVVGASPAAAADRQHNMMENLRSQHRLRSMIVYNGWLDDEDG